MHADRYCYFDHISTGKHFNTRKEISDILVICNQMFNVSTTLHFFCFYFCMVNRQRKGLHFYFKLISYWSYAILPFKWAAATVKNELKGTINLFCPGMESSTYLLIANGTINLLVILMGLISIYIFNDPNGKVFVQQRQFNSERQKRNYLRINERKRLAWLQVQNSILTPNGFRIDAGYIAIWLIRYAAAWIWLVKSAI